MNLTEILTALAELQLEDQKKVRAWLAAKLEEQRPDSDEQKLIYTAMGDVAKTLPPWNVFTKMPAFVKFKKSYAPMVVAWVSENMKPKSRAHRLAAYRLCFSALTLWMTRRDVPVSLNSMATSMPHIPAAIEEQFPGYLSSSMLPMLLMVDEFSKK